ncbi:NUDIX domain-containing protein [Rubrobacter indicoceani]|uniref:NUDIX domain-containing protein n=1 Tax=Rubrobacter indicoceani TaxID=2051957 RepID=UPI000E5A504B|nr:NUDIX hydrolase [Rubrobacter indicoceani]
MRDYSKNRDYKAGQAPVTDFGVRIAVVVRKQGRTLLVRHEKPGREPYFVLPGGRLEPGETIPECAVREVLEETGLTVEYAGTLYVNEFLRGGRHTVDITVEATIPGDFVAGATLGSDPEVPPGEAPTLVAVEWVARENLASVGLLPESVRERLLADSRTEAPANGKPDVYLGASAG